MARDIDLLKKLGRVSVSWSINTLDENFKNDMDSASSIERRIASMKQVYDAGIRTVCFVSPVFPGITDFEAIFERVKDQRSEEHTSELQSRENLVCRLLLEKKKL